MFIYNLQCAVSIIRPIDNHAIDDNRPKPAISGGPTNRIVPQQEVNLMTGEITAPEMSLFENSIISTQDSGLGPNNNFNNVAITFK